MLLILVALLLFLAPSAFGQNAAPTDLQSTVNDTRVTLSWTDQSDNELGFRVERKTNEGPWMPLATVDANAIGYNDMVASGNTYCYRVYAFAEGLSGFTNEACIAVPEMATVPDVPAGVALSKAMVLQWDLVKGATGYHLWCMAKGNSYEIVENVPGYMATFHVSRFDPSQSPACMVQAWNKNGTSGYSSEARIPISE